MKILVIAEHNNSKLNLSTNKVISAAKNIGGEIDVLVAGKSCENVAQEAVKLESVKKVLLADDNAYENFLAENIALLVSDIAKNYTHILAPASTFGKDFMPRVAAALDCAQISDAVKIIDAETSNFLKCQENGSAVIEKISTKGDSGLAKFISKDETKSARPELTSAGIVISGGRGLGSADNFKLLEKIADKLKAAIGASRAAVDAGYVPNDYQVGQTGKIIAPDLYIAVGISGAIQHLAGMKDSKVIVAINKDENAPIFEIADYGLVGDLFQILPELEKELSK